MNDNFPMPGCRVERVAREAPDLLRVAAHGTRPGGRCRREAYTFEPVLETSLTPLHAANMEEALARGADGRDRAAETAMQSPQDEQAPTPANIPETTRRLMQQLECKSYRNG